MRTYQQDEILIMPYCAPQPEYTYKGEYFPSRITEEQFKLLKDCGINMVMGHEDMMNSPTEAVFINVSYKYKSVVKKRGITSSSFEPSQQRLFSKKASPERPWLLFLLRDIRLLRLIPHLLHGFLDHSLQHPELIHHPEE